MSKSRLYDDDVLVIGLGRFGGAAAVELQKLGHRVLGVEIDGALAESYLGRLTRVVQADAAEARIIDTVKARSFSIAVVGIGSSVEASVLASANLVDAGVESIWAKALSPEHGRILERIGVHNVVRPEADSGRRVAHLVNGKLQDFIEFDDGFAIIKMRPPQETLGFTLEQSALRSKYGVTVVGVKSPGQDFTYAIPQTKVMQGDTLIVAGKTELLEKLAARP
ncbi:TrkA family potassium uptake protein [Nostocoides sp. F2B08]|uniref:potassium channel family protein n=1 Tax=Nostocoides sp. F2B08 TaxID=2653936 RepID=UPI0012632722|nr:TrkA family potassium uptake protein [Tetrasphaera sp. F2B08]KAB7746461.1 TrkA family potassium uptake protein [Tetrasphaera sp. F2B08]